MNRDPVGDIKADWHQAENARFINIKHLAIKPSPVRRGARRQQLEAALAALQPRRQELKQRMLDALATYRSAAASFRGLVLLEDHIADAMPPDTVAKPDRVPGQRGKLYSSDDVLALAKQAGMTLTTEQVVAMTHKLNSKAAS